MSVVQELYHQALAMPSDIREHLETLSQLARGCRHVTEFGTRTGNSTRAFLQARPEVLVCYDREHSPEIDALAAAAREAGRPRFEFHPADVLQVEIKPTDLLFIDTFHVYEQLQQELARHAGKARKYLVFHDTTTYGEVGEQPGSRGLWPAIAEFLQAHPEWTITARFTHNNGLTILAREGALPLPLSGPRPNGLTALAPPDTAVVVPVRNALDHIQHCLRSLVATCPGLPLIIVDDASDAATHAWLRHFLFEECPGPHRYSRVLLRNERQQLFTRTVNRGLRRASQLRRATDPVPIEFAAVVNSDCVLHDHWLKALRLGMEDPRVGLVGYCDRADGREPALRELREPDYIAGHCMLLRMAMLEEIGVLCETDTEGRESPGLAHALGQAHYGSDRALCWRANRAGWKTLDCHCRLGDHAGGGSEVAEPGWLSRFELQPLWPPCDRLENPAWVETTEEERYR